MIRVVDAQLIPTNDLSNLVPVVGDDETLIDQGVPNVVRKLIWQGQAFQHTDYHALKTPREGDEGARVRVEHKNLSRRLVASHDIELRHLHDTNPRALHREANTLYALEWRRGWRSIHHAGQGSDHRCGCLSAATWRRHVTMSDGVGLAEVLLGLPGFRVGGR